MIKRLLLAGLLATLAAVTLAGQSSVLRPRFGSRLSSGGELPSAPSTQITVPSTDPAIEVSVAALQLSVLCTDDVACTAVTWACAACTTTSGSATDSGNGVTWTFSVELACTPGAGSANTVTVTGSDGTLTSQDSIAVQCIVPDGADPVVTITSPAGATDGTDAVAASSYTLGGTCTDDVACDSVTLTCSTCSPTSKAATFVGSSGDWTVNITLASGANAITITALDQASKSATDTVTTTYTPPLRITTAANLGTCVEDVAGCSKTLSAADGTAGYTWSEVGSNLNTGNCTGLTLADSGDNGIVSGTPNPASVPVTCTFTARVTDGGAATVDQEFTIGILSASAETKHEYFEYQTNNRSACTGSGDVTDANCIIQIPDCPNGTYSDNGACSLRVQAQLTALGGTGSGTESQYGKFNYVFSTDTYSDKQDAAKLRFIGEANALALGVNNGIGCGTDDLLGCASLPVQEQLLATYGPQRTGTITYIIDDWFGNEWKSNGPFEADSGQSGVVPDTDTDTAGIQTCGGGLGNTPRWKLYRVDAPVLGHFWAVGKLNFERASSDDMFDTGTGDSGGFWNCSDDNIGVFYSGSQNSERAADPEACPDCPSWPSTTGKVRGAGTAISPWDIGLDRSDQHFVPPGRDGYHLFDGRDYPLKSGTWSRMVAHIKLRVPIDSPIFDDWRANCDPAGASTTLDAACAATNTIVSAKQDPLSDSIWHALYVWRCDETRGCQRIIYGVPFHAGDPADSSADFEPNDFEVEINGSRQWCRGCNDRVMYVRNMIIIKNISVSLGTNTLGGDLDDAGCPESCPGDSGAVSSNVLRKPVR